MDEGENIPKFLEKKNQNPWGKKKPKSMEKSPKIFKNPKMLQGEEDDDKKKKKKHKNEKVKGKKQVQEFLGEFLSF